MATLPMVSKILELGLRRFSRSALVIFGLVLVINALQTQARSAGPKVVVSEYRHDFGEVFAGQFMDHVFTIRNEGTSPLTLSDAVPHAPNASGYRPAIHPTLANRLVQGSSALFPLNAATKVRSGVVVVNAAEAESTGPLLPAPT
jgi:hypothetical protein